MTVAHPFGRQPASGWEIPTGLAIGDRAGALLRGQRVFWAAEREATTVLSGSASERLDRRDLQTVWIELEGEFGPEIEALLRRVDADVEAGRYGAVVSAVPKLIDPVIAAVGCPDVEVVINGSDVNRAAALALAGRVVGGGVRDGASDVSATRLRQLSEEVGRIAASLARLSGEPAPLPPICTQAPPRGDMPHIPAETVRSVIKARRLRDKFLPADLFADPAWDMLLDLLQAEIVQHRVPVSSLCIAAPCPPPQRCVGSRA